MHVIYEFINTLHFSSKVNTLTDTQAVRESCQERKRHRGQELRHSFSTQGLQGPPEVQTDPCMGSEVCMQACSGGGTHGNGVPTLLSLPQNFEGQKLNKY